MQTIHPCRVQVFSFIKLMKKAGRQKRVLKSKLLLIAHLSHLWHLALLPAKVAQLRCVA